MDFLEREPEVQKALDQLLTLLSEHETIKEFKKIQIKAQQNQHLKDLEEAIKAAQKDAVQFAHYDKPEAEKQAIAKINALTKEYETQPLVVAYREKLIEADELLQYVTKSLQRQMNQAAEEAALPDTTNE